MCEHSTGRASQPLPLLVAHTHKASLQHRTEIGTRQNVFAGNSRVHAVLRQRWAMAGPLRAGWQALRSSTASLLLRNGSAAAAATSLSFPATPARFATQPLHQVAQPDSPSTSGGLSSARGASFAHLGLATPSRGQVGEGRGKWPAQQHARRLLGRRVCVVCSPDAKGASGPNNLGLHSNWVPLTAWAPACSGSRSHVAPCFVAVLDMSY